MSQENLDLARHGMELFVAGDWETLFEDFDPEVEWEETPSLGPDAATYRGIQEVRGALESWIGMWTNYALEVSDYLDAGEEVVCLLQEGGTGRTTGASVERGLGVILKLRDGKVIRVRLYGSWAKALEAAGLSE